MRYKHKTSQKWALGAKRTRSGFLFFPKTIENETRWLERAVWEQLAVHKHVQSNGSTYHYGRWIDVGWLSSEATS